jgi:hypothetical protein
MSTAGHRFTACSIVAILLAAWVAMASHAGAGQRLADFRRVVVASSPGASQQAAAEELADLGRSIEILRAEKYGPDLKGLSFFVGDKAAEGCLGQRLSPWQREEYVLRTIPIGLVLAGDYGEGDPWSPLTRAGSMMAVYTVLDDHLGVHWFWPAPAGEHVPHDPQATLPRLDRRAVPKFSIRSVSLGYTSYHTKAFSQAARKWARRSRLAWTQSAVFGHSWGSAFNLRSDETFKSHPE